jgi:ligand-binding sensor domain-containing protein/signal transduction histidine kinase
MNWGRKMAFLVCAARLGAAHLPAHTFTSADGMPRDAVFCVVPDQRGFLWLCTADGIAWFDGYAFHNFGVAQGLAHRGVNTAIVTSGGTLLVATDGGLSRLDASAATGAAKFQTVAADGAPAAGILGLVQDLAGVVWAATYDGVFRLDHPDDPHSRLRLIGVKRGKTLAVTALAADRRGNLWLATTQGLAVRRAGGALEWSATVPPDAIQTLLLDRQNRLWVGTLNGLRRYEISQGTPRLDRTFHIQDGLINDRIHCLYQSSSSTVWIGTALSLGEVWRDAAGRESIRNYSQAEGLRGRRITAIGEDRGGNLWVGVDNGLTRISREGFVTFSDKEGMAGLAISALVDSEQGMVAVSNHSDHLVLHRFGKDRFVSVRPQFPAAMHYFGWGWEQTALRDRQGGWWFATGEGVVRFPPVRGVEELASTPPVAVYTSANAGLPNSDIFRLFEDSRGDIWIGTIDGAPVLWHRATGRFERLPRADFPGLASAFAEDRAGNVWMGVGTEASASGPSGLARYANGRLERFAAGAAPGWISSLLVDHQGRLWIATADAGLGLIADPAAAHPRFEAFPARLSSSAVRCLTEDPQGRIWAGTARGMDRVNPSTGEVLSYNSARGYQGGSCSGLRVDSSGSLWAGSSNGLSRFVPSYAAAERPPGVYITGLSVLGEPRAGAGNPAPNLTLGRLSPRQNQLHIEFSSPAAVEGRIIRYEYRLEGAVASVTAPAEQRIVDYPLLSSGRYRFLVSAVDERGQKSPEPAAISFEILPPIWARWWFIAFFVAAATLIIHGGYRLKLQRQLELERLRARIAADLHDDLGASLSRVAIMSESARLELDRSPEESRARLGEIASTARGMVDGMSDLVWSIDPRKDDMRSLLRRTREFASDVLESQGIDWRLEAGPGVEELAVDASARRHLFLILKEALANAARHAQCSQVTIRAEAVGPELAISIVDDGRGFDESAIGQGNGLENMRRRAEEMGGSLVLDGRQGARLLLRAPLGKGRRTPVA